MSDDSLSAEKVSASAEHWQEIVHISSPESPLWPQSTYHDCADSLRGLASIGAGR